MCIMLRPNKTSAVRATHKTTRLKANPNHQNVLSVRKSKQHSYHTDANGTQNIVRIKTIADGVSLLSRHSIESV